MAKVAMLIDESKCIACCGCQVACKQWNNLPPNEEIENRGSYENPPDLSPNTWTRIKFTEYEEGDKFQWLCSTQGCMHCTDSACVEVCPTEALKHHPEFGFVTLEQDRCNGCGYCVQFCPFSIPQLEITNTFTGEGKTSKCNLCQGRVTNGMIPACVKACPSGTLSFGEFSEMVAEGKKRVEILKKKGFANAQLYGDNLLNGLGRIYVLTEKPEAYGLPENPEFPVMATVWQSVIQPLGGIVVGAGVLGLIVNFFVARRNIKVEEEIEETEE